LVNCDINVVSALLFKVVNLSLCRSLPRAILIGIPMIIVVYILINVSFFAVLSIDEIINSESEAIAIVSFTFLVIPCYP